ncbi:MAG: hypothetical protein JXL80_08190 [Planctomycetes bacterium]|nr:hypothetical protein [Planctomycetota bacterium]
MAIAVAVVIMDSRGFWDANPPTPVAPPDAGQARVTPSPIADEQPAAVPAKPQLRRPEKRVLPSGVGIVQPGAAENAPLAERPETVVPAREGSTPRLPIQRHIEGLDLTADQKARIAEFEAGFQPTAAERLREGDAVVLTAGTGIREAYATGNREQMDQARATMMQAVRTKMETLDALSREYLEGIRFALTPQQVASAEEFLKRPQTPGVEIAVPLVGSGPADPKAPDRQVHEVIPLQGSQQQKPANGTQK